jgi:hypothetical protein
MCFKINLIKRLCFTVILLLSAIPAFSQCDFSKITHKKIEEGFVYVKSHEIAYKENDRELNTYSVILSRGVQYKITLYDNNPKGKKMVVTLLDSKDNPMGSNYDPETKTYYNGMNFECKATGNYYLEFSFQDEHNGCGIAVLSIKKN